MSTATVSPAPASAPSTPVTALAAVRRVAGIGLRGELAWLTALPAAAGVLTAVLAPNYDSTYTTPEDLARAVASSRLNKTSAFLYGTLPDGADVVQLAVWELGALTCLVLGVVIVLRAVAVSRTAEEAGGAETLRAAGAGPVTQLAGSALILAVLCLLLGAATGGGLLALEGTSPADAAAYGACVALTCALLAGTALLAAQLLAEATSVRGVSLALVALLAAGHGAAAAEDWDWAGALSPFSLRGAVDPGGRDDWTALAIGGLALAVVLVAAGAAARARDLGAGALRLPQLRPRPLTVRGPLSLGLRLCRVQTLAWAISAAALSGVLTAMGEGVVDLARQDAVEGGSLGPLLRQGDPGAAFLGYIGSLVGCLAAAQAVVVCGRLVTDERAGRLEAQRATGTGTVRLLVSWWAIAAATTGLTLAASTATAGLAGASALETDWDDALRLVGGQWPAAIAAAGVTAALCGAWPRSRAAAWAPVLLSLGIAQLGDVLDLPQGLRDAAPLALAGERSSLWLLACGLLGLLMGAVAIRHRDLWADAGRERRTAAGLPGEDPRRNH